MGRRPRVLLLAEAANPVLTSTALLGWRWYRALREVADVHLVSEARNRGDLDRADPDGDRTSIDNRLAQGASWRIGRLLRGGGLGWSTNTALATLAYPRFERRVIERFGADLAAGEFDLVHRVTPSSPTAGGPLPGFCRRLGVPLVIGPINGGVPWPKEFPDLRRREGELLHGFRRLRLRSGLLRTSYAAAGAVLCAALSVWRAVPAHLRDRCFHLPENLIDPAVFPPRSPPSRTGPMVVVCTARLVPYKGVDLLLDAAEPAIRAGELRLEVIGDGPQRQELERRTAGSGDAVVFHGWLPQDRLDAIYRRAHAFALPSLHEFGGGAVLEAMAASLVPVVVAYGGPAELVPEGTGLRVGMDRRDRLVAGLRAALERLIADDRFRVDLAGRAAGWAHRRHTMTARAHQLAACYRHLLGRGPRPPRYLIRAGGSNPAPNT